MVCNKILFNFLTCTLRNVMYMCVCALVNDSLDNIYKDNTDIIGEVL